MYHVDIQIDNRIKSLVDIHSIINREWLG